MQVFLFGFLLLFHLFQACDARDIYTSVLWEHVLYSHAENKTIAVSLNSQLYFICPNLPTVARQRNYDRQTSQMNENIWLTDNETAYENCEMPKVLTKTNHDFFSCDNPNRLTFLSLLFLEHAAGSNDRTFEGGKYYYVFSTSNGYASTLKNKKGGHCETHNMRIKIYVCKKHNINETNPDCENPNPQLNWLPASYPFTPVPLTDLVKTPLINSLATSVPAITTDTNSNTHKDTKTVMTNATEGVPVIVTDAYINIDPDTETMITKTTETTPTGYDESLAAPVHFMWEIGYNQTLTVQAFEDRNYPVVALCKEPNTKISLLNNKGTIVDSWLCQKVGDRLTILKPEYRNGDVYQFEASPEYSLGRVWKSKLSINVGSFKYEYISKASPLYDLPALTLLMLIHFIGLSAF
ncbi:hypothetical protein [Endozoicomonas sp. 8E]|uniref:hypothetical protein n=1 Tax=Endozoicomonas sp. 8E TaxID=3035692 RepID=UPI00293938DF|nr:hypothetical protein [Endozoicomonas sp. 8E]WOG29039.1 hypothetical protein P6910_05080 [Endozoicomonas sp. 8E]